MIQSLILCLNTIRQSFKPARLPRFERARQHPGWVVDPIANSHCVSRRRSPTAYLRTCPLYMSSTRNVWCIEVRPRDRGDVMRYMREIKCIQRYDICEIYDIYIYKIYFVLHSHSVVSELFHASSGAILTCNQASHNWKPTKQTWKCLTSASFSCFTVSWQTGVHIVFLLNLAFHN